MIVHEVRTPSVKFAEVRITALSVFLHGDYGVKVSISDCGSLGVGSSPTNHPKKKLRTFQKLNIFIYVIRFEYVEMERTKRNT